MSLHLPRRGIHHDSGFHSIRHRSWAGGFGRVRSLPLSSSGTLAKNKRPSSQTAQETLRALFFFATTTFLILRKQKVSTFPPHSCRRRAPTTLLQGASKS